MVQQRDLGGFTGAGYSIGRARVVQAAWMATQGAIFQRWWCPARLRVAILRAFGASVGHGVLVRHRVRIHWPWKLSIGDNTWVGEGAWILNLEQVTLGRDVCISQDVLLCTGSHDHRSKTFEFDNAPIVVEDGAWVAARATVLRGVKVGAGSVIGACSLVKSDVVAGSIVAARGGNR